MLNLFFLKRILSGLLVILASQLMIQNSYAQAPYVPLALAATIAGASCSTCHTAVTGTKLNVKTDACTAAFRASGSSNYTALKTCLTPAVVTPVVCALPNIRNPATNTCVAATTVTSTIGLVATSGAVKTDVWTINCPAPSTSLSVAIKDNAPVKTPILSIQTTKGGLLSSVASSDNKGTDGDALYSPLVKLASTAGVYTVLINKSENLTPLVAANNGAESYTALFSCQNAAGSKVANGLLTNTQNQ